MRGVASRLELLFDEIADRWAIIRAAWSGRRVSRDDVRNARLLRTAIKAEWDSRRRHREIDITDVVMRFVAPPKCFEDASALLGQVGFHVHEMMREDRRYRMASLSPYRSGLGWCAGIYVTLEVDDVDRPAVLSGLTASILTSWL